MHRLRIAKYIDISKMHCKENTSIDIITAGQLDFGALNFAQCVVN